jgi:hypothetical protein
VERFCAFPAPGWGIVHPLCAGNVRNYVAVSPANLSHQEIGLGIWQKFCGPTCYDLLFLNPRRDGTSGKAAGLQPCVTL